MRKIDDTAMDIHALRQSLDRLAMSFDTLQRSQAAGARDSFGASAEVQERRRLESLLLAVKLKKGKKVCALIDIR